MTKLGVIGWPVGHSVSPAMHNAALQAVGLGWQYVALPAPPADLPATLAALPGRGYRGVNVTIPHKVAAASLVDDLSTAAREMGSVNTILWQGGRSFGDNTDGAGFLTALQAQGFSAQGCCALILGAGGSARAVAYALVKAGALVSICNRTPARAEDLLHSLAPFAPRQSLSSLPTEGLAAALAGADLLVNTTPLGMAGGPPGSPLPAGLLPRRDTWVFDLVYRPEETPLLQQARAAGAATLGGLDMLVQQGALSFALWTGQTPPLHVMAAAARAALRGE